MMRPSILLLLLLAGPPCLADDQPSFVLTTDTLQYCNLLARQITERRTLQPDVLRLLSEGREMCDHGEIRGGIRRLRRALLLLHHKVVRDDQ